jgi:MoaA/NifB/PqqE/SkfB family radical SAM enzyme
MESTLSIRLFTKVLRDYLQMRKKAYDNILRIQNRQYVKKLARFYFKRRKTPYQLVIEPTNICNANCIFCAYDYNHDKKAVLSYEDFKRAVDEYYEMGGKRIQLTPITGEALIDINILEKLEYLRIKNFQRIGLFTNLSLLHKFDIERFLCSGITNLYVSTAPLEEALYKKIYRNNQYKNVLNNLSALLETFQSVRGKTIKSIEISFRSDRALEECKKMPDYKKYVEPFLCDDVSLSSMRVFDSWNGAIKPNALLNGMKIKSPDFTKLLPCTRAFTVCCRANGELLLCGCRYNPFVTKHDLLLGNISNDTIYKVYNSDKTKKIINSFFDKNPPEVCKNCSWYGF